MRTNLTFQKLLAFFMSLILIIQIIAPTIVYAENSTDNYLRIRETNTTVSSFKNLYGNIIEGLLELNVYKNNVQASDDELIATGMELKDTNNSTIYTMVIRGDINCDGKLSVTDLSQFKLHETGIATIEGARLKAADINNDGNVTVLDRSQLKMLLVGLHLPEIVIEATDNGIGGVTVTVTWPAGSDIYTKQISVDSGNTYTNYTEPVTVTQNTVIIARLVDSNGKVISSASLEITNLGNLGPEITSVRAVHKITNYLTAEVTAQNANGIGLYYFTSDEGKTWEPENGQTTGKYTFKSLAEKSKVTIQARVTDLSGHEARETVTTQRTFSSALDILSERLPDITLDYINQAIILPDGRIAKVTITEEGSYAISVVGGENELEELLSELATINYAIADLEKQQPATMEEVIQNLINKGIGNGDTTDNLIAVEKDDRFIIYRIETDKSSKHTAIYQETIIKNGLTTSGQITETEVLSQIETYINNNEDLSIAQILNNLVEQGLLQESNISIANGTFELEVGTVYQILKDSDNHYYAQLMGLATEVSNEIIAKKILSELELGLKNEIIDWAIEDGLTLEANVDREEGIYFAVDGTYKQPVINFEDGTYATNTIEKPDKAKIKYTLDPAFPTMTNKVTATIEATYEGGIAKTEVYTQSGECVLSSNYQNNPSSVTEKLEITDNGIYTVKVTTTNDKVTEKQIIISHIGTLLPIQVTINPETPINTTKVGVQNGVVTGPISVTLKYSDANVLENTDKYQYQINSTEGEWQIASQEQTINNITENCTIYARYYSGGKSVKQIAIVIDNVDNVSPNEFTYTTVTTSHSITVEAQATDTAADSNGKESREGIAGIERYEYSIDNGQNWQTNPTFDNLKQDTDYTISVKAIDFAGNETMATNNGSQVKTQAVPKASDVVTFEYSNKELTKDSVIVTINTSINPETYNVQYQAISNGTKPVEENWVNGLSYETTENCKIYVRIVDAIGQEATNGEYAIGEVINIDNLSPKEFVPEVTAVSKTTITLKASNTNDGKAEDNDATGTSASSGIASYQYYLVPTSGEIVKSEITEDYTYTFENLKPGAMYNIYVEVADIVGNKRVSEIIQGVTNAKVGEYAEATTTITGLKSEATYNNPIIPAGFAPVDEGEVVWGDGSTIPSGWNDGLILQDRDGNQFIWVPVDGENVTYEKWVETGLDASKLEDGTLPDLGEGQLSENDQVDKYKGYYIGRFESSKLGTEAGSKKGENAWTGIRYESAKNAAEKMYQTSSVRSGLVTGKQWDTLMKWIATEKGENYITIDTTWGNYTDSKQVTGSNETWKAKNIYDIAGNVQEITNELYDGNVVARGGAYNQIGVALTRNNFTKEQTNPNLGFRTVLYVVDADEYIPQGDGVLGIGNINKGPANQAVNGLEGSYLNPVVPVGFMAVNTDNAKWTGITPTGWNKGLVIEDINGNQFVWVPVDGTNVKYEKWYSVFAPYSVNETQISGDEIPTALEQLEEEEIAQIEKYGGFYIGRYEAGNEEGSLVSKAGMKTVNGVTYEEAKTHAEAMYNTAYVKSGLLTGTMWDTTMKWIANESGVSKVTNDRQTGNNKDISFTFSGDYAKGPNEVGQLRGEYETGNNVTKPAGESYLLATGLVENFIMKNIYDLAGNVWEYTSEYATKNGENQYIARGADYYRQYTANQSWGAAIRENISNPPGESRNESGFRVALFLTEGAASVGQYADYNRTINGKPASYDNPVIPAGFAPINTDGANWGDGTTISADWNNGLVIENEAGNQFVWVPVNKTDVRYSKWTERGISYKDTEEDEIPALVEAWGETEETQVNKYGGFYVARYESSQADDGTAQSKSGVNAWTSIDYNQAKIIAESMPTKEKVKSGLITGTQWDTIMKWISTEEAIGEEGVITDSSSWGNYEDSNLGRSAKAKNIYELAGGNWEWTTEGYSENKKIYRGGVSTDLGAEAPAAYRGAYEKEKVDDATTFRMVLYITGDVVGIAKHPVQEVGPLPGTKFPGEVNAPELSSTMTPVKWDGNTWVKTTESDSDWYNYTDTTKEGENTSKWANAITADGRMWGWIARYAYKITGTTIDVKFLSETTNTSTDGESIEGYTVHPAFINDTSKGGWDHELTGIWVGKFETSGNTITTAGPKPGLTSFAYKTGGVMFDLARNATLGMSAEQKAELDTHMAKNTEWGAITYLAHSKYGRNGAVIQANNSVIAGNGYKTNTAQSTTGNVYGVYDMAGGRREYVAAYFQSVMGTRYSNLSNIIQAHSKYKQAYGSYQSFYGDAMHETPGWQGASYQYPDSYEKYGQWGGPRPLFERGEKNIFAASSACSNSNIQNSYRMILIVEKAK